MHFTHSVYFESYTDIIFDSDWQSVGSKVCDRLIVSFGKEYLFTKYLNITYPQNCLKILLSDVNWHYAGRHHLNGTSTGIVLLLNETKCGLRKEKMNQKNFKEKLYNI